MMFLDCPAYLDEVAARCGLPAKVRCSYTMHSTDEPEPAGRPGGL